MGQLTDDMRKLRSDINALKASRENFRKALCHSIDTLKQEVHTMQSGFRKEHAEMAQQARQQRETFVANVGQQVIKLKQQVAGEMKAIADELKSAHHAWHG
jgi:L-lactate utilization protein LutB